MNASQSARSLRVLSLLPGATEIVSGLGLYETLVGVSHACDHPPDVRQLPCVTQPLVPGHKASSAEIDAAVKERARQRQPLYKLDIEQITRLKPTHIVTQGLCDVCAVSDSEVAAAVDALGGQVEVIKLEPRTVTDVLRDIVKVGEALGAARVATQWAADLLYRVETVALNTAAHMAMGSSRLRTVVLEWLDPPFGCGHWTPQLVDLAGGMELLGKPGEPSRELRWQDIVEAAPEVLVLASCGMDLERTADELHVLRKQPGWADLPAVKAGRVYAVDGSDYFNRPGPRIVDSLEILAHALWPKTHALPAALERARNLPV